VRLDYHAGATPGNSKLGIYDIRGRLVRRLAASAGTPDPRIHWDGLDEHGAHVPDGVYFLRLEAHTATLTERITVVR
jgi:flagellar hook assembly protein FlgD